MDINFRLVGLIFIKNLLLFIQHPVVISDFFIIDDNPDKTCINHRIPDKSINQIFGTAVVTE